MKKLEDLGIDTEYLLTQIKNMELGDTKELKDIYGTEWDKLPTGNKLNIGKIFKSHLEVFLSLEIDSKQGDNHILYKKVSSWALNLKE